MENAIRVRPARSSEVVTLAKLVKSRLPDMMSQVRRADSVETHLAELVPDQALLVATHGTRLAGLGALDLDHRRILACYLDPEVASPDTPRRLFEALERHALRFGIRQLNGVARKRVAGFMRQLGYECRPDPDDENNVVITRDLLELADEPTRKILDMCDELGVPEDYGVAHRMPLVTEAKGLVFAARDIFEREQRLTEDAADAFKRMRDAALNSNIELRLVSGFRATAYQASLFRRKLDQGHSMKEILQVSAPPGYSEHHSGRAIDVTTRGVKPLVEDFAQTEAYKWLLGNARVFGFRESYPRHNRHRIAWEPWHWYFTR
ncbi:D-alanyl-D-alanine carboxypeptidase family protein [Wenzhouxiangella sp. EGI_FJ10409]|uniref:D-alanyl-D-alanine carboxypeptidase family protein n=1 Tax=Wenzhouxiangella sp. EGI_FJ10409 TaxID=3243767 RepID=UPI0035D5BA35